jgi:hypothetical protein
MDAIDYVDEDNRNYVRDIVQVPAKHTFVHDSKTDTPVVHLVGVYYDDGQVHLTGISQRHHRLLVGGMSMPVAVMDRLCEAWLEKRHGR